MQPQHPPTPHATFFKRKLSGNFHFTVNARIERNIGVGPHARIKSRVFQRLQTSVTYP